MSRNFYRTLPMTAAIAATSLLMSCTEKAGIEGKYRDERGNPTEFLADGTAVAATSNGQQLVLKWTVYDGGRIKLENTSADGGNAAVCSYTVDASSLRLTDCPIAMALTRL